MNNVHEITKHFETKTRPEQMADIPKVESRWTDEGFNLVFEQLVKTQITYVEAYRQAELQHVELFGKVRYASYDSFRVCRKKLIFGQ